VDFRLRVGFLAAIDREPEDDLIAVPDSVLADTQGESGVKGLALGRPAADLGYGIAFDSLDKVRHVSPRRLV
jgi:hypothetical protein